MIAVIGLEAIGDDHRHKLRFGFGDGSRSLFTRERDRSRYDARPRAWIARVTGRCPKFGLAREFMAYRRDYAEANSTGSRGVFKWYELPEGDVYEISAPISWTKADRYFARSTRGKLERLTLEEVYAWIDSQETSQTSTKVHDSESASVASERLSSRRRKRGSRTSSTPSPTST